MLRQTNIIKLEERQGKLYDSRMYIIQIAIWSFFSQVLFKHSDNTHKVYILSIDRHAVMKEVEFIISLYIISIMTICQ